MIGSLLLLLDIDGTLCPVGPGPDVEMRHLSIGAGAVSFRADLPEVLAELAARYELAWATAWQDNANLLLAPALGLPTLPVVRFTDPAPDEVGSRYTGRTWKLPSVQGFAADRPLAWIDDDLHGDAARVGSGAADPYQAALDRPQPWDRRPGGPLAARVCAPHYRLAVASQLRASRREPRLWDSQRELPRAKSKASPTAAARVSDQIPDGHCGFRAYLGRGNPAKAAGVIAAVAPANPDFRCVW